MKTILFYDTETTGFPNWKKPSDDESQPHIVQIGAVLCNAETKTIIKELDIIVKPDGWEIPQVTTDVHGITNEYALKNGIPENEALQMFLDLRGDSERVAYNKTFDQRIIRIGLKRFFDELTQEKWAVKEDHHCAMVMSKNIVRIEKKSGAGYKNPKLVEAFKFFTGEEMQGAHDALADTRGCMRVYFAALEQGE